MRRIKRLTAFFSGVLGHFAFYMLVLTVVICVTLVIAFQRLAAMQRESAFRYLSSNLHTVSATIDQIMRDIEYAYALIYNNVDFKDALRKLADYDSRSEYADFLQCAIIRDTIRKTAVINDSIDSIYVYSFTAKRVFSSKHNYRPEFNRVSESSSPWLLTYRDSDLARPWHITDGLADARTILTSYREMRIYGEGSPYGLLSINMDAETPLRILAEATPNESDYAFLIDANGKPLGATPPKPDAIIEELGARATNDVESGYFETDIDDLNLFVTYYASPYSGFTYIAATSLESIQTMAPVMWNLLEGFVLIVFLVVVLFAALVNRYFYMPVKALLTGMRSVQEGDFEARLPENTTYEFSSINRHFNEMTVNLQRLIKQDYTNKLVIKEIQLRSIQDQLNEHFLYNTLDSIHWLARKEGAEGACEMVFALAKFYRLSLSFGRDVISVRDSLETLRQYLLIQKSRMSRPFVYTVECSQETADELILKNILQPLVENALMHGLKGLDREGSIEVMVARHSDVIRLSVRDNGVGFSARSLESVRQQLYHADSYDFEQNFALKTLQSQLRVFYDGDIRLNIESDKGAGAVIWFDVPLYRSPKEM